jgi:hypothetical protein
VRSYIGWHRYLRDGLAAERALDDMLFAALRADLAAERAEVERLRAQRPTLMPSAHMLLTDEIDRLRTAGDALAEVVCSWHEERIPVEFLDPLTAWEEARRER